MRPLALALIAIFAGARASGEVVHPFSGLPGLPGARSSDIYRASYLTEQIFTTPASSSSQPQRFRLLFLSGSHESSDSANQDVTRMAMEILGKVKNGRVTPRILVRDTTRAIAGDDGVSGASVTLDEADTSKELESLKKQKGNWPGGSIEEGRFSQHFGPSDRPEYNTRGVYAVPVDVEREAASSQCLEHLDEKARPSARVAGVFSAINVSRWSDAPAEAEAREKKFLQTRNWALNDCKERLGTGKFWYRFFPADTRTSAQDKSTRLLYSGVYCCFRDRPDPKLFRSYPSVPETSRRDTPPKATQLKGH